MASTEFSLGVQSLADHVNGPYVQFLRRLGLDLEFVRAEGAVVFDSSGRRFIDCVAGYGNLNVGHNHPRVIQAVVDELRSPKPFNLPFLSRSQAELAEEMERVTPGDLEHSFFVNSGSEAVDSALKLVRLATGKPGIICARRAWHGFTCGAMSVSEPDMTRGFAPLLPGVVHVPYGDADAVEASIGPDIGAVIVEPIQAESGAIVPADGYLRRLAALCRARGIASIFDEVKTGMGKTGRMFACQHEGAVPDILLAGKSLGGGAIPIASMTARRWLWGKFGFSFPMSSSSGAGNTPACAAALATLAVIRDEGLVENAAVQGVRLAAELRRVAARYPEVIQDVTGRGLLQAVHLRDLRTATAVVSGCARRGVLVMAAFGKRTSLLYEPPLVIDAAMVDEIAGALRGAVEAMASQTFSASP